MLGAFCKRSRAAPPHSSQTVKLEPLQLNQMLGFFLELSFSVSFIKHAPSEDPYALSFVKDFCLKSRVTSPTTVAWVLSRIHTLSSALVYIELPLNAGPQDLYTCSLSPARAQRQIISAKQWWDNTIHMAFTKSILRYASRKTASSLFISGCCYSPEPLFYLACTYFSGKSSSKGKLV